MARRGGQRWVGLLVTCGVVLILFALVGIEDTYTFDGRDVGPNDVCMTWDSPPGLGGHPVLGKSGKCGTVAALKDTHLGVRIMLSTLGAALILVAAWIAAVRWYRG